MNWLCKQSRVISVSKLMYDCCLITLIFSLIVLPGCTKTLIEEIEKKPKLTGEHVIIKVGQEFAISLSEFLTGSAHWFFLAGNNPGLELIKIQIIRNLNRRCQRAR